MANSTHIHKIWVVFCDQEGVSLRARKIYPYMHSTQLGLFTQRGRGHHKTCKPFHLEPDINYREAREQFRL